MKMHECSYLCYGTSWCMSVSHSNATTKWSPGYSFLTKTKATHPLDHDSHIWPSYYTKLKGITFLLTKKEREESKVRNIGGGQKWFLQFHSLSPVAASFFGLYYLNDNKH